MKVPASKAMPRPATLACRELDPAAQMVAGSSWSSSTPDVSEVDPEETAAVAASPGAGVALRVAVQAVETAQEEGRVAAGAGRVAQPVVEESSAAAPAAVAVARSAVEREVAGRPAANRAASRKPAVLTDAAAAADPAPD